MKLEIRGLTRRFGSFTACDHIDLTIEPGEIHCLLGENGAGKSTLMNMLYGLLQPTEGELLVDDEVVHFDSPGDAIRAGIGMVHQHFMLVPVFTVAENIMLGREQTSLPGVLDRRKAAAVVRELSQRHNLAVDPDTLVEELPVGVQQRVEILKALSNQAKVLILDEPTAVLTPQEIEELMGIMRSLKEQGTSIIFITHKLREVKAVGDRITVIRRGKVVGTAPPSTPENELAEMMVGREVKLVVDKKTARPGAAVLEVEGVTVVDPRGHQVVKDVSFEARSGEVLGIAGVQGNGQTELIKALMGLVKPDAGRIRLEGREISHHGPRESLEDGIGYIPEDRSHDGYVATFSVQENLVLDLYREDAFSRGLALRLDAIEENAADRIREFDIRTESAQTPVGSLSGGNQQKVVVAREFSRPLKALIASQPTRGVDVGSIEFIHQRIVAERDRGTAVVIVSTELDEIFALSDRIAVMYDGRIVATVDPSISREDIGLLMAGATPQVSGWEGPGMTTSTPVQEPTPEELRGPGKADVRDPASWLPSVTVTLAALVLALVIGAVIIVFSDRYVLSSLKYFGSYPWDFFTRSGHAIWDSYSALVKGAVGSGHAVGTTLERSAPLICAGLGVTLAFRAGLFNIGAQGQLVIAGLVGGYVAFGWDLPAGVHLLVAVVGMLLGGALWGGIAGFLKARTGAHEVITTIMMNYLAGFILIYLLGKNAYQRPGSDNLISPPPDKSATFPSLFGVHIGVALAFLAAIGVWWVLDRSTLGFELRAVGANPDASRTAGMSVAKVYTLAMVLAGLLSGLAAAMNILGHRDSLSQNEAGSIGFDAITVALLGRATPLGTVLAGLLFGAMSVGGVAMQASAGTPRDLTSVIQALIVLFIAAPALVKGILRMRTAGGGGAALAAKGWGG